ncbi:unnamed protein product [Dicrocoelium dendriticum]|nr:unnamed protein product [Dicrocoelium dendriticum]
MCRHLAKFALGWHIRFVITESHCFGYIPNRHHWSKKLRTVPAYLNFSSQPHGATQPPTDYHSIHPKLQELVSLAQSDSHFGRWSALQQSLPCDVQPLDQYFTLPLGDVLSLKKNAVLAILRFVCSLPDESLAVSADSMECPVDSRLLRLNLLNPNRIATDICDPLSHVGVRQPGRLVSRCPALLVASATSVPSSPSYDDTIHSSPPITHYHRNTVMTDALSTLGSLLPRTDLISLINRFPAVLLRPSNELNELYSYLTEQMGLQFTESVRAMQVQSHQHAMRHSTGLRLVNCPAWCMSLEHVKARHSLALLAGCWPPAKLPVEHADSPDRRLAGLLTCSNAEVSSWLGLDCDTQPTEQRNPALDAITLSSLDVDTFHYILSRISAEE